MSVTGEERRLILWAKAQDSNSFIEEWGQTNQDERLWLTTALVSHLIEARSTNAQLPSSSQSTTSLLSPVQQDILLNTLLNTQSPRPLRGETCIALSYGSGSEILNDLRTFIAVEPDLHLRTLAIKGVGTIGGRDALNILIDQPTEERDREVLLDVINQLRKLRLDADPDQSAQINRAFKTMDSDEYPLMVRLVARLAVHPSDNDYYRADQDSLRSIRKQ